MKLIQITLAFLFLLIPLFMMGQLSVMTYNVRYDNPNDKENWWEYRKADILDMLSHYSPDIIGIQEGLHHQVTFLDSALIDFDYVGVGRDDGKKKGEFTAIFYNSNRLRPLNTQTYWLSNTPDKVSIGWDASMERITTFGEFKDVTTGDTLYVFNAHFDHIGPIARENSAKLINQLIESKGILQKKIVVIGDFNCLPTEAPIVAFKSQLDDSFDSSHTKPYGPKGTWCSFDTHTIPERRIDYILTRNVKVNHYRNIDDRRPNNLHLSDHLPVFVEIK